MNNHTAIILTALGGPEALDDVGPFITAFMGRVPPPPILAAVQERYVLIGGKSPLVDIVTAQSAALQNELGCGYRVYPGFRYVTPSIADSVQKVRAEGANKIIALSLSPYETEVTTGKYKDAFESQNLPENSFVFIPSFHDNPLFIQAWQEALSAALSGTDAGSTVIIFTGHSIPMRYIEIGNPYKAQIEQTVRLITDRFQSMQWSVAWQSKGARATEAWIEPDVESTILAAKENGAKSIVEVPVGFTCDHLETLYDIDIVHRHFAEKQGLSFSRVPSLNTNPLFISALADIVQKTGAVS